MDRERSALREAIAALPVWDTHTHLRGSALAAESFWDIGHYFWYLQELRAAGYPAGYRELPEERRAEAYVRAYHATRNTAMHWAVAHILGDLYGITLTDAASVRAADEAVRAAAVRPGWAAEVCRRAGLRRIVVNEREDAPFDGLPGTSCYVPRVEGDIGAWLARLGAAPGGTPEGSTGGSTVEEVGGAIDATLGAYAGAGCGGVMTSLEVFGPAGVHWANGGPGRPGGPGGQDGAGFVLRALCAAAARHGLFLQLLSGIEAVPGTARGDGRGGLRVPLNDPRRLLALYPLFREAGCAIELVLGSSIDNLEAVQAATHFPNVHVGGMWWYNFRPSTYRESMRYRLEGLPALKSALIASDARCIEWAYGKVLLVKRLLAEVLQEEIERGWLDRELALEVAGAWLYGSAAARYSAPAARGADAGATGGVVGTAGAAGAGG